MPDLIHVMFTTKLKSVIYSRKIREAIGSRVIPGEKHTRKVGLITDQKNLVILGDLHKDLGINQNDFRVVSFGSETDNTGDSRALFLNAREISIQGTFRSEEVVNFSGTPYDFLICYFSEEDQNASLLAAKITAGVKIGNTPDAYDMYDLEIRADSTREFRDEVLKYYRILKKE